MRSLRARPTRWLASLLPAIAFLVIFAPTTVGGATTYVIVSGTSMSPTFSDGDLVVVRRSDYAVGEVVAFETGRGLVIHRIVGGSAEEGFVTQGDNKESPDIWHPTAEDIVGEHYAQIPGAGRWVQRVTTSPALLGVTAGGLGSLMLWSPKRRRKRGAHLSEVSHRTSRAGTRVRPLRGAGTTLLVLATSSALLAGLTGYLLVRPLQRLETVEQVRYEHRGEFSYTAVVEDSVVYDSETIGSPSDGSEPTAIYTELLDDLRVGFDYTLVSPRAAGLRGSLSAELRIATGEGVWTRTVPLLAPQGFEGSAASATFSVDIGRVLALVARGEEATGLVPGLYQLTVLSRVDLRDGSGSAPESFVSELGLELRDKLLVVTNELTTSETVTQPQETLVPNDLDVFGALLSTRLARAIAGALLVMLLIAGALYGATLRRRLGKGEVAKIRLRYGPLIVPVAGPVPNGARPVDMASMADLARLARRAEQMVFHAEPSSGEHWFFVPDGPVTYQYHLSNEGAD